MLYDGTVYNLSIVYWFESSVNDYNVLSWYCLFFFLHDQNLLAGSKLCIFL